MNLFSNDMIDRKRWDAAIGHSTRPAIYAMSWYLDIMCPQWKAIVWGDYKAVMPLPTARKWVFNYVYTPAFIQQLGVFSDTMDIDECLKNAQTLLKKHFSLVDLKIHDQHNVPERNAKNYILDLNHPFEHIRKHFKRSFMEAFKQTGKTAGEFSFEDDLEAAFRFNDALYDYRSVNVSARDYGRFKQLVRTLKARRKCYLPTWRVEDRVLAQAIVLEDDRRYYLMTSACLEEGRALRANHALMYHLLQALSEQQMIFDFEGSNIPGVAAFYESMGAVAIPYARLRINHLLGS